jgi:hypothetical protein
MKILPGSEAIVNFLLSYTHPLPHSNYSPCFAVCLETKPFGTGTDTTLVTRARPGQREPAGSRPSHFGVHPESLSHIDNKWDNASLEQHTRVIDLWSNE